MSYDYKEGRDRIQKILTNTAEIKKKEIPKDDSNFTYDNGIKCWIGSIFVDIVGSKDLIENKEDIVVAKILRAFTSEIISVLNNNDNMRQIGIRCDCVYGVFSCAKQKDTINFIELLEKDNSDCRSWFTKYYENDKYEYYGNIIKSEFNKWIDDNI